MMVSLPEPEYPPDHPLSVFFSHFVWFFRKANEMTPEEKAAENDKRAERKRALRER